MNYKSGARGAHPDDLHGRQMASMTATLIDEAAIDNVIAHIQTFPDEPAPATIEGDITNGERL
jgi:cytochrome c oxidase subunit 2